MSKRFTSLTSPGVLALFVPQLQLSLSPSTTTDLAHLKTGESRLLGIFTCLNVIALILIFFFVPESAVAFRGVEDAQGLNYISLEELNYIFNASTRQHIEYQIKYMVPWGMEMFKWKWKHYLLRKGQTRPDDPHPLFTWIQAEELNDSNERFEESTVQETVHEHTST